MTGINLPVAITPPPPGQGCYPDNATLFTAIAKSLRVTLPVTTSFFIISSVQPTVEQRTLAWIKIDAVTNLAIGVFTWSPTYGAWAKDHWNGNGIPTLERRMFIGSLTQLETYDGGEAGTVSDITGPFWVQDTDFGDKFPLGVGATITTVATNDDVFDDAVPGAPQARSVYFAKPSGRLYDRGA
jgi:hypothetical protein